MAPVIHAATASGQALELRGLVGEWAPHCVACQPGQARFADLELVVFNEPRVPVGPSVPVCGECLSAALTDRIRRALT